MSVLKRTSVEMAMHNLFIGPIALAIAILPVAAIAQTTGPRSQDHSVVPTTPNSGAGIPVSPEIRAVRLQEIRHDWFRRKQQFGRKRQHANSGCVQDSGKTWKQKRPSSQVAVKHNVVFD